MSTAAAPKRTRPWGQRFKRLLLDEYLDTVPEAGGDHGFQAWLVRESGVKRATISTWWASSKRPDLVSLAKLRRALPGLTVTEMVAVIEGVEIEVRSDRDLADPMVDLMLVRGGQPVAAVEVKRPLGIGRRTASEAELARAMETAAARSAVDRGRTREAEAQPEHPRSQHPSEHAT